MRQLTPIYIATLLLFQAPIIHAAEYQKTVAVAEQNLSEQLNAVVANYYKANEPGATVIIVKNGKTVLRSAYGMANAIENMPMQADDVMRLGSITKQFTAVGIMMLVDEGKISLSDKLSKFIPDYPEAGNQITVEHLLTHTSGVPNYTSNPNFVKTMEKDMSVKEMIATFKDLALEFEPGTRWNYSNSGYFLLGAIIEKVSGVPYAKFVEDRIFVPLKMKNSAYEGYERTKQRHAEGHSKNKDGFEFSKKLSMSQPYAAGSLISTVDDLATWDAAISSGALLKAESWKKAFTPYVLKQGEPTNYGYGWSIGQLEGSPMISHGGGINGFSTYELRLPEEKVYVAVLTNADRGLAKPEMVASRLAAKIIGKAIPEFTAVKIDAATLDQYVGVYKIDEKNRRNFVRDGDKLIMTRTNGPRTELQVYAKDQFFIDEQSLLRVQFVRNAKGEVIDATVMQNGTTTSHPRTTEAPPKEAVEIRISNEVFDTYVGDYQIAPSFILNVRREGDKFITQATNQPPIDIIAIADNVFLAKQVGAQITFEKGSDGKIEQLILKQGGQNMPAKKVK
jgi:D-alanyl-D-alanine carboxypeptidase